MIEKLFLFMSRHKKPSYNRILCDFLLPKYSVSGSVFTIYNFLSHPFASPNEQLKPIIYVQYM